MLWDFFIVVCVMIGLVQLTKATHALVLISKSLRAVVEEIGKRY